MGVIGITSLSDTLRHMELEDEIGRLEEQNAALVEQLDYIEDRAEKLEDALEAAYYALKGISPTSAASLRRGAPIVSEMFPA